MQIKTLIPPLKIASRGSPLAKAQVEEVLKELRLYHPSITFSCSFIDTTGDKDQKTSLRSLGKTNFFTKEIDDCLLSSSCRLAIHSAKDLPEPLPDGLSIAALTKGKNPADALVLKPDKTLSNLPKNPLIATSSIRREEAVIELIPGARFTDVRGPINERLNLLKHDHLEGVVIAEAALIRLELTHLNRLILPGHTTLFQGQLAIVVCSDDHEMLELFKCIDSRNN